LTIRDQRRLTIMSVSVLQIMTFTPDEIVSEMHPIPGISMPRVLRQLGVTLKTPPIIKLRRLDKQIWKRGTAKYCGLPVPTEQVKRFLTVKEFKEICKAIKTHSLVMILRSSQFGFSFVFDIYAHNFDDPNAIKLLFLISIRAGQIPHQAIPACPSREQDHKKFKDKVFIYMVKNYVDTPRNLALIEYHIPDLRMTLDRDYYRY